MKQIAIRLLDQVPPPEYSLLPPEQREAWRAQHTTRRLTRETELRAWLRDLPCKETIQ